MQPGASDTVWSWMLLIKIGCIMPEDVDDRAAHLQVARLSARLQEREGQLSEAEDCYRKLDDLYQAEKSDHAAALASKVWLLRRSSQKYLEPALQDRAVCHAFMAVLWELGCACQGFLCQ